MTTPLGPLGGGAALERRPLKSALKTRKGPSSRRGEARQQWEAEQTALMVSQAQARLARERKIYETCEALCAPGGVEIEQLEEAAQWLSKDDYKDVIKERSLRNLCGYPLCVNNADGSGGDQVGESSRVKLLLYEHQEHKKGKQSKGRKFYCSNGCHRACGIFSSNLLEYRPLTDLTGVGLSPAALDASPLARESAATAPLPTHPTSNRPLPPSAARASAANAAAAAAAEEGGAAGPSAVLVDGIWRSRGNMPGGGGVLEKEALKPSTRFGTCITPNGGACMARGSIQQGARQGNIVEKTPLAPSTEFTGEGGGSIEGHRVGSGGQGLHGFGSGRTAGRDGGGDAPSTAFEAPTLVQEDPAAIRLQKEMPVVEEDQEMWGETLDVIAAMEDMSLRGSIYFRLNLHMHHWASARVAHLTDCGPGDAGGVSSTSVPTLPPMRLDPVGAQRAHVLGKMLSKAVTTVLRDLRIPLDVSRVEYSLAALIREFEMEHGLPSLDPHECEAVVLVLLLLLRRQLPALAEWLEQPENATTYLRGWHRATDLGAEELAALQLPFLPPAPETDMPAASHAVAGMGDVAAAELAADGAVTATTVLTTHGESQDTLSNGLETETKEGGFEEEDALEELD